MSGAVCVFAGSSPGFRPKHLDSVRALGRELVSRKLDLVYGGAHVGLMGALADTVIEEGGRVIGIIPRSLEEREVAHQGLSDLHVVESMPERKVLMEELSDGFIAAPGGSGTLDEFFEMLTLAQLGLHKKPCGLLNVDGYFAGILQFLDHAVSEGFLRSADRSLVLVEESPGRLLDHFESYRAPRSSKLVD